MIDICNRTALIPDLVHKVTKSISSSEFNSRDGSEDLETLDKTRKSNPMTSNLQNSGSEGSDLLRKFFVSAGLFPTFESFMY
jgi:hypothetical protein